MPKRQSGIKIECCDETILRCSVGFFRTDDLQMRLFEQKLAATARYAAPEYRTDPEAMAAHGFSEAREMAFQSGNGICLLGVGPGFFLLVFGVADISKKKQHFWTFEDVYSEILLMATRNPGWTHQLSLVVGPSQHVMTGSSTIQKAGKETLQISGRKDRAKGRWGHGMVPWLMVCYLKKTHSKGWGLFGVFLCLIFGSCFVADFVILHVRRFCCKIVVYSMATKWPARLATLGWPRCGSVPGKSFSWSVGKSPGPELILLVCVSKSICMSSTWQVEFILNQFAC